MIEREYFSKWTEIFGISSDVSEKVFMHLKSIQRIKLDEITMDDFDRIEESGNIHLNNLISDTQGRTSDVLKAINLFELLSSLKNGVKIMGKEHVETCLRDLTALERFIEECIAQTPHTEIFYHPMVRTSFNMMYDHIRSHLIEMIENLVKG